MRKRDLDAAAAALILLLAGCTGGGTHGSSMTPVETGPISHATGPTDLVVRASSGGGLLPESLRLAELPDVSIYGDGRVILLGSHATGPQDPLLPELIETRVTADAMDLVLAAARDGGALGPDRRYDLPGAYDLWTVAFVVTANGTTHRVSVYALGFDGEDRLAPPGEMDARRSLGTLHDRLQNLRAWLPQGAVAIESTYEPPAIRVFMSRLVDWSTAVGSATPAPASPRADQEIRNWPFGEIPEAFGTAIGKQRLWYCAVVGPDDAVAIGLDGATWDTRWRAAGNLYQIVARPLLPDESGCPTGT